MWLLTNILHVCSACKPTIDLEMEAIESILEGPLIFSRNLWTAILSPITEKSSFRYVTGFGKTLRMGFFVKTEFDASLISSTLELTHLQV